jgi:aconitate hydratase
MFLGVKAVVARSIERIHLANLINFGIVPFLFQKAKDCEQVSVGDKLSVANVREILNAGKGVLRNETRNVDIPVRVELTERQVGILLAGGLLNVVNVQGK